MATYYVGIGGNNSNDGTSWANRKLTLNGAEDIPVVADDIVYVGAGTYREQLTVDVAGTDGHPITYIGDYTGANTDGIGGVVRITGSDDDITTTRNYGIYANAMAYRTFMGFRIDLTTLQAAYFLGDCTGLIVDQCYIGFTANSGLALSNPGTGAYVISNCYFEPGLRAYQGDLIITHSSTLDNRVITIQNCSFNGAYGVVVNRVGGATIKNSTFDNGSRGVQVAIALTEGQTITVNNCILCAAGGRAFDATAEGEITENYNTIYGTATARNNVAVGANSLTYPPMFDSRWFFEMVGGGKLITPLDLSANSQLINVAGTSPSTTDMRGASVIGAQREWGALEYDADLYLDAGYANSRALIELRSSVNEIIDAMTDVDDILTPLAVVDGIVDEILVDTGTTLDGKLDTIDGNVDSILADTGTDGVVLKAAGLAEDAVNKIADQVWNEAIADHTAVGSFGAKNQKVVPSETVADYKADVSALTNVTLAATQTGVTIPTVTTVTNGVTLADDAITSAKFDESTAYPLKSADTGATAVARTGADSDTLETLSDQIDGVSSLGTGATSWTYNLVDESTNPISDADIWVTTDIAGSNVIASGKTDVFGDVTFYLDAGTYYIWGQKSGYNFTNPDTEVVT